MAGCANYITKPFEPDLLMSEVRKYVKPALIPMTPYKPKKKAAEKTEATHKGSTDNKTEMLAAQLAGLILPDADQKNPAAKEKNSSARLEPQSPEPVSVRADDLPAPDNKQPVPTPPQHAQPEEPKPETLSAVAEEGTAQLDKLLAELEQDDDIATPAQPTEPFRSRCPGCRTVFRNVRPDDYDKHARCKKCGSRFHLGDHLVV